MSEKENGKKSQTASAGDKPKPAAAAKPGPSGTVWDLFRRSKTKPYLLEAFCLFAKTTPEQTMSESEFEKALKNYLKHQLK